MEMDHLVFGFSAENRENFDRSFIGNSGRPDTLLDLCVIVCRCDQITHAPDPLQRLHEIMVYRMERPDRLLHKGLIGAGRLCTIQKPGCGVDQLISSPISDLRFEHILLSGR